MLRFSADITVGPEEVAGIWQTEEMGRLSEGNPALDAAEDAQRALRELFESPRPPKKEHDPLLPRAQKATRFQHGIVSQSFLKLMELLHYFAPEGLPRAGAEFCVADVCALPGSMTVAAAFCAGKGVRVNWFQLSLAPAAGGSPDVHGFSTTARRPRCYVGGAFPEDVGDVENAGTRQEFERRRAELHGGLADLVIADGFPNVASRRVPRARPLTREQERETAHYYKCVQQQAQIRLAAAEVSAAFPALAPGGALVVKLLDVYTEPAWFALIERLRACFAQAHLAKPMSSAPGNSELYFVGMGFVREPAHLEWAERIPRECFGSCPGTMCAGEARMLPQWAAGLAPLHRALAAHTRARMQAEGQAAPPWCAPEVANLWMLRHMPLLRRERLGLMRDAPRGLFKVHPKKKGGKC
jgi:23S rRNA U2552 (ribose-2'-O)-methylase RlmE/FtsJ